MPDPHIPFARPHGTKRCRAMDPEVCVKVLRIVLIWVLRAIHHRSVWE
jgi:hypothetical protein